MSEIAYQVYANNPSMADDYTQKVIYLSDRPKSSMRKSVTASDSLWPICK
ncbi:MAG: hypothetical protein QM223_07315 [Bacteroidota bacterium]|nr:hypothetical protein [Bacteroidota bacterium]